MAVSVETAFSLPLFYHFFRGFDTSLPVEGKKHVGLRNIRGRLKAMVNGELLLESKVGVGTKAVIMIPKE